MAGRLGSLPFAELLANSLAADATTLACANALDGSLFKSARAIPDLLFYAKLARDSGFEDPVAMLAPLERLASLNGGLGRLPAPLLDLLAWQLHVDGYEAAVDHEARLRLVQMSLLLHRRKGTPWSVKNALKSAFLCPVELCEWFNYGGRPYFFRVAIDVDDACWGEDFSPKAWRLIFEYKNVRSWLEEFLTRARTRLARKIAVAARSRTLVRPCLWFRPVEPARLQIRPVAALMSRSVARPGLWFGRGRQISLARRMAFCGAGLTRTYLQMRRSDG